MRIALVPPLLESASSGGRRTERVIAWLRAALADLGHDVTIVASGDPSLCGDASPCDVIHFLHTGAIALPSLRRRALPHNPRAAPHAAWLGNVPHVLPLGLHTLGDGGGGYLAFLGRVAPDRGLDRAIEITRRAGARLAIAARIEPAQRAYHARVIEPLLARGAAYTEMLGELDAAAKDRFLGDAHALLFPVDGDPPSGLAMLEAMACGTPVIGWRRGAVPELIEDGITGFVVDDLDAAAAAVRRCGELDRAKIRARFAERFSVERLARDHVELYEAQLGAARDLRRSRDARLLRAAR